VAGCLFTLTKPKVREGAPLSEHAVPVHGFVLAHPWVALGALAVLAWKAVAYCGSLDLVALIGKFAAAVLVELAYSGHSELYSIHFSETGTLSVAQTCLM
jgi:hypothetical protein